MPAPRPTLWTYSLLLLLSLLYFTCGPAPDPAHGDTSPTGDNNLPTQPVDPEPDQSSWPEYTSASYGFSLSYPAHWTPLETQPDRPFPIINFYPEDAVAQADFPLDVHGPAGVTYIAVFPEGFGTELPSGEAAALSQVPTIVSELGSRWDQEDSQVFRLKDGTVWGLLLRPRERPANWSEDGYVFAQFGVDNFRARCFAAESDREIPMQECDPMTGDRVERSGTVADAARRRTLRTLAGWRFETSDREPIENLLRVEQPLPNNDVSSPLQISGEARGYWYFEADFPVRLETYDGAILARGVAEAEGDWMTESFVPFRTELRFDAPDDERGYLVFERANPSGRPENDRSFRLPVLFPPAK